MFVCVEGASDSLRLKSEAGPLLTLLAFSVGVYLRWVLIQINMVIDTSFRHQGGQNPLDISALKQY